jgi:hypothetical protein
MVLTGLTAWTNFRETLLRDGVAVSLGTDPSVLRIPALAILLSGLIFRAVLKYSRLVGGFERTPNSSQGSSSSGAS